MPCSESEVRPVVTRRVPQETKKPASENCEAGFFLIELLYRQSADYSANTVNSAPEAKSCPSCELSAVKRR